MTRTTMTSNEAKQQWGSVMKQIEDPDNVVIVESYGRPKAAVISVEKLEQYELADRQQRRQEAWRRLEALREEVSARNADLSEEEIEQFAVELGREVNRRVVEKILDERAARVGP